jgi:hypothetical protein
VQWSLSGSGDPRYLTTIELGDNTISNVEPVTFGDDKLDERRDVPVALCADAFYPIAALKGDAKRDELGATVSAHGPNGIGRVQVKLGNAGYETDLGRENGTSARFVFARTAQFGW